MRARVTIKHVGGYDPERAGSPLEPLEAACEEALREELAQVTRERDEAREELAAIERTRIAAREILAMRWTGPTPADEARASPAELGPSEARRSARARLSGQSMSRSATKSSSRNRPQESCGKREIVRGAIALRGTRR